MISTNLQMPNFIYEKIENAKWQFAFNVRVC